MLTLAANGININPLKQNNFTGIQIMNNLFLHCGANRVDEFDNTMTMHPESMGTQHAPIAHSTFLDVVKTSLDEHSLSVTDQAFGTLADGSRFFGLLEVAKKGESYIRTDETEIANVPRDRFSTMIGLRASHDKSISAGLIAGSRVFVCDNLAFSGEVKIATKQTTKLLDRLPELVYSAVGKISLQSVKQADRVQAYQEKELSNKVADAAMTQLVRIGAINPSQIGAVIDQWDTPRFEQFAERRDVWRLYNAVTECYKPASETSNTTLVQMTPRSIKLTGFMDTLSNLEPA